jgi:caffeoyl-CoA O-methyltransferase
MMELLDPKVYKYLDDLVPQRSPEMKLMEKYADDVRFPIIGPASGQLCYLLARATNAKSVFELGSGYGYSTAWFAKAVQENGGGTVYHVVWDEKLSQQAHQHLERLGYNQIVQYQVSEALQALRSAKGPFDLIFNDINKEAYPESLPLIKEKLRSGGLLIIDNMLWSGKVFDDGDKPAATKGIREFTRLITGDPDWIVSLVPIRDGLIVAYKK